jgi:hypothetical protein
MAMEKAYWIARKRAALKLAEDATSCEARLVHCELARLYSVKAADIETAGIDLADALPPPIYATRGDKR